MNLNNVTKTMLRDFVDAKITVRKTDLRKDIQNVITDRLGESLKNLLGDLKELEKHASKFEDLLTEKIHLIGAESVPDYARTAAQQANKLCKAHTYFLDEVVYDAMDALLNDRNYRFKSESLKDAFNALNIELQPKIKLYNGGLDTLKKELNHAISNEQTGKRAYNALVALGMDMKDLPEVNPNLPAVTKLSIDVCVLNGNCAEKSA